MFNLLDLFSGAGGLSYGFEQSGFRVLAGIDNDRAALDTFERNHDGAKTICADITTLNFADIKEVIGDVTIDVIVGGPPCQGMSLSGPRRFGDPRNSLYLSYIRLVEEIRPKAFVIENVPGLVGLFGGEIKDSILEKFRELGYTVDYKILTAADYGVPQMRRRVFFVGFKSGEFSFPAPISVEFHVTCEDAISDLPPLVDTIGEVEMQYFSVPMNYYQQLMRVRSSSVKNHIAARHSEHVRNTIALIPPGGNYKNLPEGYTSTRNFNVE